MNKICIILSAQFQHSIEKLQKYYNLVSVVCYPQLFILIFNLFLRNCKTKCFNYFTLLSCGTILQRVHIQYIFMQNAHASTLTSPKGQRYYHHIASSVVCKSLTLTLEGRRRGVYSVPSLHMRTPDRTFPGTHEHRARAYLCMLCTLCFSKV